MNLNEIVCDIEYSKKLKELGFHDSIFVWYFDKEKNKYVLTIRNEYIVSYGNDDYYPAFLSDELIELLPSWINTCKDEPFNHFRLRLERALLCKDNTVESLSSHFVCNYYCDSTECLGENAWLQRKLLQHNFHSESLANCLVKMLIYLIENNLLTKEIA